MKTYEMYEVRILGKGRNGDEISREKFTDRELAEHAFKGHAAKADMSEGKQEYFERGLTIPKIQLVKLSVKEEDLREWSLSED